MKMGNLIIYPWFILASMNIVEGQNKIRFLRDFFQNKNVRLNFINFDKRVWNVYGVWNRASGLIENPKSTDLQFHGLKFKIALVLEDGESVKHLEDFRLPQIDVYTKQNLGAITTVLDLCNITYEFVRVPNYQHLFQENYDFLFTGSAPYMTKTLLPQLDFVRVQNSPRVCYLLKRPPTSYVTTIFTVAFESAVWYAVILCLVLLSIALFAILNIEGRRQAIKNQEKFNPMDLALIALEAVCQQGTSTDPRSYSGRILEVIMFTAFMFLYVSYSANILVLLQSTTHINTIQELNDLNIKVGGMNTSTFLQYHKNEIGTELYQSNINGSKVYSIGEGMEKVRQGLFAYFHENQYGYNYVKAAYTDYEVCGLQELAGYFQMNLGYIAMPKGSPYKEILKIAFLKVDELGLQRRHYNRYFLKPQCYSKGSSFDAVGIAETYQAMLLVMIGVFAGLLVLAAELLLHRFKKN